MWKAKEARKKEITTTTKAIVTETNDQTSKIAIELR